MIAPFQPLGLWLPVTGGGWSAAAISVLSFVLCVVLAVSYVRAFHVVAIPLAGLLAQVSLLRLPSGHSGQILTLSNAQPPLASDRCRHLRCFSAGGVTTGLVICGF